MLTRPKAKSFSRRSLQLRCAGFTLLEMSAVVFVIAVLVSLLCAALNHTKAKALRVTCLDNIKQLQHAWMMYAGDNDETLPLNQTAPAPDDPRFPQWKTSNDSWVAGNPRQDLTTDNIKMGSLYPYVGSVGVYRCPMDDSTVYRHPDTLRTRSYAMSSYLGGDSEFNPKFKFGEITRPDNAFVFIEEHQDSRWMSSFWIPATPRKGALTAASSAVWFSTPSDRHSQGCNISFADGHIEYWRWYAPKDPSGVDSKPGGGSPSPSDGPLPNPSDGRDFLRLQSCLP